MDIAGELQPETHDAIRKIQKAMFIMNMNLHKPSTAARRRAVSQAACDIQVAADQLGVEWP